MKFEDLNVVAVIVALLGTAGIGATFREIVGVIIKVVGGMSVREESRKRDIVDERNTAVLEKEIEANKRRILEESYAELRRVMIATYNIPQADLPPWPEYEQTLPAEQVRKIRRGVSP